MPENTITTDHDLNTTTDYQAGWGIVNQAGETVATIVRVDVDEARIAVEQTDGQRFYVYIGESLAWVDRERRTVAAQLTLGTRIEDEDEGRVGTVVEATPEEVTRGEEECCCFNPGSAYVLVEWSYEPGDEPDREWEAADDLFDMLAV